MPVPVHVISSPLDLQRVFAPSKPPGPTTAPAAGGATVAGTFPLVDFVLCYEPLSDGVTEEGLDAFRRATDASASRHGAAIALSLWDCSGDAFVSAKRMVAKEQGHPLLLLVHAGAVMDTVRGVSLAHMMDEDIPRVCERLAAYQRSSRPAMVISSGASEGGGRASGEASRTPTGASATPSAGQSSWAPGGGGGRTLRVDVARVVSLGEALLKKDEPVYAEKAFVKALEALKAVEPEVLSGAGSALEDYEGSVAMTLAWAGLAQVVQGKALSGNTYLKQLTEEDRFARFREEPLSMACCVATAQRLMLAAPSTWSGATCSQRKLREALAANPTDHDRRAMLVITLFLAGDMERALTEAVKLRSLGQDFGRIALKCIVAFLGPDHVLVHQLGPLTESK